MAERRRRRSKAAIEAEKLAKAAAKAEEERMLEAGYEKKRTRDSEGHFIKDDPSTPENEAWEWVKKGEDAVPYEPVARDREAERTSLKAKQEAAAAKEEKPAAVASKEVVKEEPVKSVSPAVSKRTKRNTSDTVLAHATCRFKEKRGRKRGLW